MNKCLFSALLVTGMALSGAGLISSVRAASLSAPPPLNEESRILLGAMKAELQRSRTKLYMKGYERPYFISYQLKENDSTYISGSFGTIDQSIRTRTRYLYSQVRVGDYTLDNREGFQYNNPFLAPLDNDVTGIRDKLWLLTDAKYKQAIDQYLRKKAQSASKVEEKDRPDDFSREKPAVYLEDAVLPPFDRESWEAILRRVSGYFTTVPELIEADVNLRADRVKRYLVNTEGTEIVTPQNNIQILANARTRAEDGMLLTNYRSFYVRSPDQLPSEETLLREIRDMVEDLLLLRKAPAMEPFTGPAIFAARVTGVFFHEVVGHRLEGERQKDEQSGQTFKDEVGKEILPRFISILDDPTLPQFNGTPLNGFYRYDDEGVPAQPVVLVNNGILKNFLLSRTPIKGFSRSNGHGRNALWEDPVARMGNTIIRASQTVKPAELKRLLIEEIKKRGKPYGLYFKDVFGGETNTSRYGFQAFKGVPTLVYKVYPDGREELVRGVEVVGTPLISLTKIIAAADDYGVFNGMCGAESGWVPVSTIAPSVLLSEIELQRSNRDMKKPPLLPPPQFDR